MIFTRDSDGDRSNKYCRCAGCGIVRLCTPRSDFYTTPNSDDLLMCEGCMLSQAAPSPELAQ